MIETTIPEINVSELMERVRATAAEIHRTRLIAPAETAAPPAPEPLPPLVLPKPVKPTTERVLHFLDDAEKSAAVAGWIPKPLRRFFRRQSGHNRNLVAAVSLLARANAQLSSRLEQLTKCVEIQHGWLHALVDARDFERGVDAARQAAVQEVVQDVAEMKRQTSASIRMLEAELGGRAQELELVGEHLRNLQVQADRLTGELSGMRGELSQTNASVRAELDHDGQHLRNLQVEVDRLTGNIEPTRNHIDFLTEEFRSARRDLNHDEEHLRNLQKQVDGFGVAFGSSGARVEFLTGEFRTLREEANRAGEHLRNLQTQVDRVALDRADLLRRVDEISGRRSEAEQALARLDERQTTDGSFIKAELSQHRSMLDRLAASGRPSKKAAIENRKPLPNATGGMLDAFYVSFEDRFRGSRSDIKERVRFYLQFLPGPNDGSNQPVVDLGCGRGEWLELLKEEGFEATGVDTNSAMLARCRERDLNVVHADAVEHLRSIANESLGGVTGFHIIEHLPFEVLMALLDETLRVLKPGGVAIFESPNCKNLVVGASNFYSDPTHINPVFPDTAQFMLALRGFDNVEIRYRMPVEGSPFDSTKPEGALLHDWFFGPRDFAVVARKALG